MVIALDGCHPVGARRFLGPFATGTNLLGLTNLPSHSEVTVSFDLLILLTWDGNGDSDNGPDIWTLSVAGGQTLLRASFLNTFLIDKNSAQSYPDDVGLGLHDGRTGAVENNTLGYSWNGCPVDSVYHLTFTFPHTASSLILKFAGMGLQAATDESWGLDNIAVFAGPLPPTLARGPQNQYASLGDVTTFAVRAAGSLDLSYQWFFHGALLPAQTNATLTITNVQFTHAGAYSVRVSNSFGMVETQPVSLSVFDRKPEKSWEFATGSGISCPPAVGRDGTVYVCGSYKLYALKTSSGLAKSAWPMFRHDPRHTANAAMPFVFPPTVLAPVAQSDGTFSLDVYGEFGRNYQIEVSADLNSWTTLTNLSTTELHTRVSDLDATHFRQRFYRVVLP